MAGESRRFLQFGSARHRQMAGKSRRRSLLWFGHHHLAELIKVHGSASILVQFLDDSIKLLIWKIKNVLTVPDV